MNSQRTIPVRHTLFAKRKIWPWIIRGLILLLVLGVVGGLFALYQAFAHIPVATATATTTDTPVATETIQVTASPTAPATRTQAPRLSPTLNTATVTIVPSRTPTATMTVAQVETLVPTATPPITVPLSAEESSQILAFKTENNCLGNPYVLQIGVKFTDAQNANVISNTCVLSIKNADGVQEYVFGQKTNDTYHGWIQGKTWVLHVKVIKGEIAIAAPRGAFNSRNGSPMIDYGEITGVDFYVHIMVHARLIPTATP